jgi:hypothetical protein
MGALAAGIVVFAFPETGAGTWSPDVDESPVRLTVDKPRLLRIAL